jgi:hypothetical protein
MRSNDSAKEILPGAELKFSTMRVLEADAEVEVEAE